MLILFEQWAGHQLLSEKGTRPLYVPIALFLFPLCLFQRELKSGRVVNSLAAWVGLWASFLVLAGFSLCWVGSHMSRSRHSGWKQCSHGLTSRPLEGCHHQCLQAVCGVLGYPRGAAMELLDGTLKLRHCTRLFSKNFSPGIYQGLIDLLELVKGLLLLLVISLIVG